MQGSSSRERERERAANYHKPQNTLSLSTGGKEKKGWCHSFPSPSSSTFIASLAEGERAGAK